MQTGIGLVMNEGLSDSILHLSKIYHVVLSKKFVFSVLLFSQTSALSKYETRKTLLSIGWSMRVQVLIVKDRFSHYIAHLISIPDISCPSSSVGQQLSCLASGLLQYIIIFEHKPESIAHSCTYYHHMALLDCNTVNPIALRTAKTL